MTGVRCPVCLGGGAVRHACGRGCPGHEADTRRDHRWDPVHISVGGEACWACDGQGTAVLCEGCGCPNPWEGGIECHECGEYLGDDGCVGCGSAGPYPVREPDGDHYCAGCWAEELERRKESA